MIPSLANWSVAKPLSLGGIILGGSAFAFLSLPPLQLPIVALAVLICALPLLIKTTYLLKRRTQDHRQLIDTAINDYPFISIHIATYDEPALIVIRSLEALEKLDYPVDRFEVIVLDNNTPSRSTWLPVQQWCEDRFGFDFYHYDEVKGAKAGALNIALNHTSPEAEFIATVDADYQVAPSFLKTAAQALISGNLSHVQFPQAYHSVRDGMKSVASELAQYFGTYAARSTSARDMLLTGTLSVIRRSTLVASGGWQTGTITEDADLGAVLMANGGAGGFVSSIQGRGLLPHSFNDLSVQRFRWSAGNAQTLKKVLLQEDRPPSLGILGQLSAWLSGAHLLLPVCLLTLLTGSSIVPLVAMTAYFLLLGGEVALAFATTSGSLHSRFQVAITRFSLLPEHSLGFLKGFLSTHLSFVRTPKAFSSQTSGNQSDLLLGNLALMAASGLILAQPLLAILSVPLLLTSVARSHVARALRPKPQRISSEFPSLSAASVFQKTAVKPNL